MGGKNCTKPPAHAKNQMASNYPAGTSGTAGGNVASTMRKDRKDDGAKKVGASVAQHELFRAWTQEEEANIDIHSLRRGAGMVEDAATVGNNYITEDNAAAAIFSHAAQTRSSAAGVGVGEATFVAPSQEKPSRNYGVWSKEQVENLKDCVKKYGRDWEKVSDVLGKTKQQCQIKVFSEVRKKRMEEPPGKKARVEGWSTESLESLMQAVNKHGKNFAAVEKEVPGKTKKQCYDKIKNLIAQKELQDPYFGNTVTHWENEEVDRLREGVAKYGRDWKKVADHVGTKNNHQCLRRCVSEVEKGRMSYPDGKTYKCWSAESCQRLKAAVEQFGRNWVKVAEHVGEGKTRRQCLRKAEYDAKLGRLNLPATSSRGMDGNLFHVTNQSMRQPRTLASSERIPFRATAESTQPMQSLPSSSISEPLSVPNVPNEELD